MNKYILPLCAASGLLAINGTPPLAAEPVVAPDQVVAAIEGAFGVNLVCGRLRGRFTL